MRNTEIETRQDARDWMQHADGQCGDDCRFCAPSTGTAQGDVSDIAAWLDAEERAGYRQEPYHSYMKRLLAALRSPADRRETPEESND